MSEDDDYTLDEQLKATVALDLYHEVLEAHDRVNSLVASVADKEAELSIKKEELNALKSKLEALKVDHASIRDELAAPLPVFRRHHGHAPLVTTSPPIRSKTNSVIASRSGTPHSCYTSINFGTPFTGGSSSQSLRATPPPRPSSARVPANTNSSTPSNSTSPRKNAQAIVIHDPQEKIEFLSEKLRKLREANADLARQTMLHSHFVTSGKAATHRSLSEFVQSSRHRKRIAELDQLIGEVKYEIRHLRRRQKTPVPPPSQPQHLDPAAVGAGQRTSRHWSRRQAPTRVHQEEELKRCNMVLAATIRAYNKAKAEHDKLARSESRMNKHLENLQQ